MHETASADGGPAFNKVAERALKTSDRELADRRLAKFRTKARSLHDTDRGLIFEGLTARWLATKKPDLRPPVDTVKKRKQDKAQIVIPSKAQFAALLAQMRKEPKARDAANLIEFLGYSGGRREFRPGNAAGDRRRARHEKPRGPYRPPLPSPLRLLRDLQEKQVRETCPQSGASRRRLRQCEPRSGKLARWRQARATGL
jgi:hypothetical protein